MTVDTNTLVSIIQRNLKYWEESFEKTQETIMMKVIIGNRFDTHIGKMIIPDDQNSIYKIGEKVLFENEEYTVVQIIPPSRPNSKWSLRVA